MAKKTMDAGVSEYLRTIGQKGGKAKVSKGFAKLSPDQRKAISKKAARARRAKKNAKPGI
jgi:hypothetical protein